jgi:hypothetical protein
MLTPIVNEIPRRLEPTVPDDFARGGEELPLMPRSVGAEIPENGAYARGEWRLSRRHAG